MARERRQLKINSFVGVDYSSPLTSVSPSRAIDILNFIRKGESTQKRKPWEQIAAAPTFTFHTKEMINNVEMWVTHQNSNKVNGLWSFVGEDGREHIIAHIGNILYSVTGFGKNYGFKDVSFTPLVETVVENSQTYYLTIPLLNEKVKAVVSGNRLYIMGGEKFLMLRYFNDEDTGNNLWELVEVEDSKYAYVPVTTTGITYVDSPTPNRTLLDAVNLLSSFRRNKLVSGTLYEGNTVIRTTRFFEYQLDSDMEYDDDFEIKLKYPKNEEVE